MTRSGGAAVAPRPLNTVQFEHPSHTGALLYGLNTLRSKGLLLDVTLIAGGEAFQAHRVVLASCSDYFRAMFTDEMRERCQSEICLNGVSAAGLQCLLEYAYTSRLCLNLANIQDVLSAAAHVQVLTVVEACSNYLQAQLDLDNCVDIATIAETYSLHGLRKRVYAFMSSHLHQLSKMADFQRLTVSQLLHLLSCDYPVDCSEAQVLLTVAGWLQHNPSERGRHAAALLQTLHLEEVPAAVLERAAHLSVLEAPLRAALRQTVPPLSPAPPTGLVNSRGLELAVVKVGGFSIAGITNEITYFMPSVGRWRHLTTIPHVEQCNYGTAVLNNELYVIGGCFNQSLQENIHPFGFRYNPQQNKWSTMYPMQRERCRFSLSVVSGQLYAVGGASEASDEGAAEDESPCEAYDPATDIWHPIAALPGARAQHAAAALNGLLYVSGGLEGDHVLDSCQVYDPSTGTWELRAPLLTPRADHYCVTHSNCLFICGGWYEDEATNTRVLVDTIDCYDPSTDTWSVVSRVPTPRYHAGIVVISSKLYVIGGFHSDATFDRATGVIECYDLESGLWSVENAYPQDIWEHVCVPLYIPRCRDDMDVLAITK
ncbi:kelch-like protein 26 [Penaeus vannamei]|uniref:kelch-like protein 26 n=1 Tax=Penaeus vannamei TaxID=6689 RepID=UPI00387F5AC8